MDFELITFELFYQHSDFLFQLSGYFTFKYFVTVLHRLEHLVFC